MGDNERNGKTGRSNGEQLDRGTVRGREWMTE